MLASSTGPGSANTVAAAVPIVQQSPRPLNISFVEGFMNAQATPAAQPAPAAAAAQPAAQVQAQPQVQAAVAAPAAAAAVPAIPPAAPASPALPPGWEAHHDANTNTTYYYHPVSGKSQWVLPVA